MTAFGGLLLASTWAVAGGMRQDKALCMRHREEGGVVGPDVQEAPADARLNPTLGYAHGMAAAVTVVLGDRRRRAGGLSHPGHGMGLSRRALLAASTAWATSVFVACARRRPADQPPVTDDRARPGRLRARPRPPGTETRPVGLVPLGLGTDRDGMLFVPERAQAGEPLPLVVMLHGAGGGAGGGLAPFLDRAEDAGVILLAPESRGRTWDVLLGGYGPDVAFVDRALEQTFSRYAVDTARVAVEGFSDGASYALGLGLGNGDLFRRIVAFSPGYVPSSAAEGKPSIFVSHGTGDAVLPIDRCSRRIVPALGGRGYDVRYQEFEGGHDVPAAIAEQGLASILG